MSGINVEDFSCRSWYPLFEKESLECIIIPVPNDVLNYIALDVMVLPQEAVSTSVGICGNTEQHYSVDWTIQDEADELEMPTFPSFSQKLKNAMNELGGQVFIKTNWHAPIDATWLVPGRTLKCTSLMDIYSLLKGSDIVERDWSHHFQESVPCVVLKEWVDLPQGCEFRCFVMCHQLIAISQRDHKTFHEHISEKKYDIMKDILRFFRKKVRGKFNIPNYAFDVVRLGRRIVILDFQPLHQQYTSSLLFTWEELEDLKPQVEEEGAFDSSDDAPEQECEVEPEFRFLAEDPGMLMNSCQRSGMPYEVTRICSDLCDLSVNQLPDLDLLEENSESDW